MAGGPSGGGLTPAGGDTADEPVPQGRGRILIRKSGTEPLIRVMAECEDEALMAAEVARVRGAIERHV